MAAGSITFTYNEIRTMKKVTFDWTSDASGDVNGVLSAGLSGIIYRITFIPDGGGTQPSNLYDVVLNETDGFDVLNAKGANLSNVTSTTVGPALTGGEMAIEDSAFDLVVTNAGNAKGGKVILYIR